MKASLVNLLSKFTLPFLQLSYVITVKLRESKTLSLEAQS
jgi:hypothetical protein